MQVDAGQLGAVGPGHVVGVVLARQARGPDIGGDEGFLKAFQVNHVKILGVQEVVRTQVQHTVRVNADDAVGRVFVDGVRPAGQIKVSLAIGIGGEGIAAGHGSALRHREGGDEQAQRQQQDEECCFFHATVLLKMMMLRRDPAPDGSRECRGVINW